MKTFLRILQFARPVEKYAIPYFFCVVLHAVFNTMNFAKIRGCSLDRESPNYVLRVLVEEHQDYIQAIEQKKPDITLKNMSRYFGGLD